MTVVQGKIITKKVADLELFDNNPKTISKERYEALKNEIVTHGIQDVLQLAADERTVLDGNHTLRVLRDLHVQEVDCLITDAVTDAEKLVVALRAHEHFAVIDKDKLAEVTFKAELPEFELETIEIDLGKPVKLSDILAEISPGPETEEDEAPEVTGGVPVSTVGSVYQLGNHRLLCGDALNSDNVKKLMNGELADAIFSDPPYNTGMTGASQGSDTLRRGDGKKRGSTRLNHMFDDSFTDEEWEEFMATFTSTFYKVLKDDSVAYICLDWRRNHELVPHIKDHFKLSNIIIWDKIVHGLGSDYKYTYELINVCKKGKPELHTHQGENAEYSDVWHIQRKMGRDEEHATKKPIELCARAIRHSTKEGDLVVDLFGGSGSTLLTCAQLNRRCFMGELDPKYVDLIRRRYQKYITGSEDGWEEATPEINGANF